MIRRVAISAVTLLVVLVVVFFALQLLPGGYADVVLGPRASEQARLEAEEKFGLNLPVWLQFIRWLGAAVRGDLGVSLVSGQPVATEIATRLPATLQVILMALIVALVLGIILGLVSGLSSRKPFVNGTSRLLGTLTLSVPDFVIGTVLVYLFSVNAWGLTVGSYVPFSQDPAASIASTVLPAVTLGLGGVALIMRTLSDAVSTTLTEPFITSSVARGDAPGIIVRRHVLRNSSTPLITVTALLIGSFLGGTIVVETLFSVPGIGYFFTNSVRNRDFAVVQGIVLLTATVFIVANLLADVLYAALDPRLSRAKGGTR
nr:ABC transporter permease [Herbiconiux sp. SALV-R1]